MSSNLDANHNYFYGIKFSSPLALMKQCWMSQKTMDHSPHVGGTTWGDQIRGSNLVEMFLIIAFVTIMNVQMSKPWKVRSSMWGNLMPNMLTIDICVAEYNFQPYGFIFVIAPITSKRTFDSTSNMHYIVCWGWQQWCTKHQIFLLKHWLFFTFNYQPCFAQLPPCAKVGEHQGWWLHRRTIWYQL